MIDFIKLQNVSFKYKDCGKEILNDISLSIKYGEFIAIMGSNGCGKSTLLKQINALLLPQNGAVFVDGINTKYEEKESEIKSKIGLVLQNPDNQIINSIVEDDVAFGPENLGINPVGIRSRVDNALKLVDLYNLKLENTNTLSGGQKQRLAIAGILAMNPSCILLDEPTSMLDPAGKKSVMNIINKLNKENKMTIVLVTHDMNEAIFADRILIMNNGTIALDILKDDIPNHIKTLKECGIELPETLDLIYRLKQRGVNIDFCGLSFNDSIEKLSKALERNSLNV